MAAFLQNVCTIFWAGGLKKGDVAGGNWPSLGDGRG